MLEGGEDPRFIARRMVVLASEDVGNADPRALEVAVTAAHAVEHVGLPECALNLAQAAVYLALAPKSNASYEALGRARDWVREHGAPIPPAPPRSAAYPGAKKLGRGEGYDYPHDRPEGVSEQELMPDEAIGERFLGADRARRGDGAARAARADPPRRGRAERHVSIRAVAAPPLNRQPPAAQLESFSPLDGARLGAVPTLGPEACSRWSTTWRACSRSGPQLPLADRARYMRRAAQAIIDQLDELAALLSREQGKPLNEAYVMELLPTIDSLRWLADAGPGILDDERIPLPIFLKQKRARFTYEPLGVVGVIAPWNYPWSIPFGEVAIALMAATAWC